jgi:hypothetical protein
MSVFVGAARPATADVLYGVTVISGERRRLSSDSTEGIRSVSVEDPQEGQFAGIVYTAPAPESRRHARSDTAAASPTERGRPTAIFP